MAGKPPKLLTASQFAARIGKSKLWVVGMCREGRVTKAQKTPLGWVIPENTQLIPRRLEMELPPELVMDVVPREQPEYNNYHVPTNTPKKGVELPGYARETEGKSKEEIYRLTGVHPMTQRRILEGKSVRPEVVVRLAHGLGLDIEDFLRKGDV